MRSKAVAAVLLATSLVSASCNRTPFSGQEPAPMDPKEREISSLPFGIEVTHDPPRPKARTGLPSGAKYTWVFATTVKATREAVTVQEFGALVWHEGRWVFTNFTGKPFTSQDFAEWYACPGARLEPGVSYVDPRNWTAADGLGESRTKWYFIGTTDGGERVRGEATMETLAALE